MLQCTVVMSTYGQQFVLFVHSGRAACCNHVIVVRQYQERAMHYCPRHHKMAVSLPGQGLEVKTVHIIVHAYHTPDSKPKKREIDRLVKKPI
jgi:hypothetical protein